MLDHYTSHPDPVVRAAFEAGVEWGQKNGEKLIIARSRPPLVDPLTAERLLRAAIEDSHQ